MREIMGSRGFFLDLDYHLALILVIPPQGGWLVPRVVCMPARNMGGVRNGSVNRSVYTWSVTTFAVVFTSKRRPSTVPADGSQAM